VTDAQDILFAVTGQTLYFDAPEGRPSSVSSVQVWEDTEADTNTARSALGSPSIESVSLTFNAASGLSQSDDTKLNLSSVTGLVRGRQFLATAATGEREWIEIARIDTPNTNAYSRTPMQADYASADTLVSTRLTATVDSTWVADTNNLSHPLSPRPRWRAVWTYVVSSVTYRGVTFFDLVRYPFQHTVTPADVDRLSRGWLSRLHTDDRVGQGEQVIAEAVAQVKLDLWERDLADHAFRNQPVLNELIRLKAVALVAEQAFDHGGVGQTARDSARDRYWDRYEALIGQPRVNQQVTESGAAAVTERAPIWRR